VTTDFVAALVERAGIAVGADETGWVEDPAFHHLLQTPLGQGVEDGAAPQGMQVSVCVETQFRGPMMAHGQFLAGIAKRLEMADGFGVLEGGHSGWVPGDGTAMASAAEGGARSEGIA